MSPDTAHADNDAVLVDESAPLCRKVADLLRELQSQVAAEVGLLPKFVKIQLQMPDDSVMEVRSQGSWDTPQMAQAICPP